MGLRRRRILEPDPQPGLVHDPGVAALQPLVPPAQALLQEADLGAGLGEMRVFVGPGADQPLAGRLQIGEQAEDRIGIAVGPAAHGIDGALDRAPVLADRAMLVEGVAALVPEPLQEPEAGLLQPPQPHLPPSLADHRRVRRRGVDGEDGRAPAELVAEQAAAHEMDVVGVAVVGGRDGDDSLQRRRPPRRHLQAVEAAPGDADHAHGAAAPGLGRDPGDDLQGVVLLLLQILAQQQALAVAAAAHVDADGGIAMAGEIGMGERIALRRAVAPAVGEVFQDRGHRIGLGVHGPPDTRGQLRSVRERDGHIVEHLDLACKAFDGTHVHSRISPWLKAAAISAALAPL